MNKISTESKQLIAALLDAYKNHIFRSGDESHVVFYEAEGRLESHIADLEAQLATVNQQYTQQLLEHTEFTLKQKIQNEKMAAGLKRLEDTLIEKGII